MCAAKETQQKGVEDCCATAIVSRHITPVTRTICIGTSDGTRVLLSAGFFFAPSAGNKWILLPSLFAGMNDGTGTETAPD